MTTGSYESMPMATSYGTSGLVEVVGTVSIRCHLLSMAVICWQVVPSLTLPETSQKIKGTI